MAVKFLVNVVLFRRISHPEQEKKSLPSRKQNGFHRYQKDFFTTVQDDQKAI
jgi:hypothetical protein